MAEYEYREHQFSLEFMKELLDLAAMCNDIGSDQFDFDIGPLDGIALNVTIAFKYVRR